ncbi:MAG: tape measure protein, partial [Gammaproteobacteria bacterium]|nr:tape measure protein [Gammaproteobacteria bacterium]
MAVNRAEFEVDLGVRGRRQVRGAARDIDKLNASLRRGNKVSGVGAMRDQLRMQRRMQDRARFQQKGGAGSVFGGLFAFEALKGASRAMMSLTKAIGGAVIGSAAFAQSQEMAFRQLSKHGVDGGRLFEHARATAQDFGLDVKNTTKQYAKFLALQFSPREADKLVAMGADLQALGNDAESVKGIFTALGQIKSKDRLQAEELLQLSERGISTKLVQEEIGKLLGKTQDEVRKLQEQGKVDAETALLGIERA